MKKDNGQHVIVCRSYGDYQVYACSHENAQSLLESHLEALPEEIKEVAQMLTPAPRTVEPVAASLLRGGLEDLLDKKPGQDAIKLRRLLYGPSPREGGDTRPRVEVTEEAQKELVLWLFQRGLSAQPLDPKLTDQLNTLHPESSLEVLKPFAARMGKPIHYVAHPEYLEAAKTLGTLQGNRWLEDAEEHRVVERYLSFVRDWLVDTSDITYHVTKLSPTIF